MGFRRGGADSGSDLGIHQVGSYEPRISRAKKYGYKVGQLVKNNKNLIGKIIKISDSGDFADIDFNGTIYYSCSLMPDYYKIINEL